jgi:4-amino-4-deoxy-L-arabinose transferase-like glycosyltransferase
VLFAITNLPWQLDDYDQAKQAFTSFEMVNEGQWLYQHTPNEKIATKPPLVGWISAATYAVTRSWEVAWRLPSIAAAVALLVICSLGKCGVRRDGGFIAMSAFGLNLLSPRLATLVRTDMPLALAVFLLGLQIWCKVRSGDAWRPRDRWIAFALLTAAMLIKGPIVYAFLLPGIIVFQWRNRAANAWSGWWPWVAVTRGVPRMGGRRHRVGARLLRAGGTEGIRRSVRRDGASVAAVLLLSPASAA